MRRDGSDPARPRLRARLARALPLLGAGFAIGASPATAGAPVWRPVAPMPAPRASVHAVWLNGNLLVVGTSAGEPSYLYKTGANRWFRRAPVPGGCSDPAVVHDYDGFVYALGGMTATGSVCTQAEVYDESSDTWSAVPPLPEGRVDAAAAATDDNRVYVIGGATMRDGALVATRSVFVYDPIHERWSRAASLAHARRRLAAATTIDGDLLAIGGSGADGRVLASVERYHEASNSWSAAPPVPGGRTDAAATPARDGRIWLAGGVDRTGSAASARAVYSYANGASSWQGGPSLAEQHRGGGVTTNGYFIYTIGGTDASGATPTATVERLRIATPPSG